MEDSTGSTVTLEQCLASLSGLLSCEETPDRQISNKHEKLRKIRFGLSASEDTYLRSEFDIL